MEFARIQSPSSINTYKQCPRKYYYQYIAELDTSPSIHLVRGKIAHSVLEDFFRLDINNISENYDFEFKIILFELLSKHWQDSRSQLESLGLTDKEVSFYLEETKQMIQFWLLEFLKKLTIEMQDKGLVEAFNKLTPKREEHFKSEKLGVQGYIDAIFEGDDIKIIDYKTSKRNYLSEAYRLQLAIYAMLYHEKYGKLPNKVGIHFLRYDEVILDVDKSMLDLARFECEQIHFNTQSKDICDYPRNQSPLCKWRTGQCDFYEECKKN